MIDTRLYCIYLRLPDDDRRVCIARIKGVNIAVSVLLLLEFSAQDGWLYSCSPSDD